MPLCAQVGHGLCPPGAYILGPSKGITLIHNHLTYLRSGCAGEERRTWRGRREVGELLQLNPGLKYHLEECVLRYTHPHQSAEAGLGE